MKFIKGARTWRSILGTQTLFWPLTPPPPPPVYYQPATKQRPGPIPSETQISCPMLVACLVDNQPTHAPVGGAPPPKANKDVHLGISTGMPTLAGPAQPPLSRC